MRNGRVALLPGYLQAGGAKQKGSVILKRALIFFLISLVAGALGFTGVSAAFGRIAKILFFIFIVISIMLFALSIMAGEALF